MALDTLSRLIGYTYRQALRPEVAAALPAEDLDLLGIPSTELPAHVRKGCGTQAERDRLWLEAVKRYRRGQRDFWGAVLLEMLAPALLLRVGRFRRLPLSVTAADVAMQIAADALETAATIPLPDPPHLMELRIVRRTLNRTSRWLIAARGVGEEEAWSVDVEKELDARAYQDWLRKESISQYPLPRKQAQRRRSEMAGRLRGNV